jgi:hypothetical protein
MKLLVVGCVALLLGLSIGFYAASAASGIKYTGFVQGKDVPKMNAAFMNGYAAGVFDELAQVVWIANEQPKYFTVDVVTKPYQCLQKITNTAEVVAWAKEFWNKEPDVWAADQLFNHACEYNASARANTMVKTGGQSPRTGAHTITLSK